jgi:import inner membrane translocase subunit TIM8
VFYACLPANSPSSLQKDLSQFIEQEQAQARVQESIHKMTSVCWDKYVSSFFHSPTNNSLTESEKQKTRRCVTGTPSTRFSRSEESCLSYCVDRFLDSSLKLVQLIQEQRNAAGGQ